MISFAWLDLINAIDYYLSVAILQGAYTPQPPKLYQVENEVKDSLQQHRKYSKMAIYMHRLRGFYYLPMLAIKCCLCYNQLSLALHMHRMIKLQRSLIIT